MIESLIEFYQGTVGTGGAIIAWIEIICFFLIVAISLIYTIISYPNPAQMFESVIVLFISPVLAVIATILIMVFGPLAIIYLFFWLITR